MGAGPRGGSCALAFRALAIAAVAVATMLLAAPVGASAEGTVAPVELSPPVVHGTTRDGSTLHSSVGRWTGASEYSYGWLLCSAAGTGCEAIHGATGAALTLGHADVGHTLRAQLTATGPGGSTTVETAPSEVIAPAKPSRLTAPGITGLAQEGQLLSLSTGTFKGTPPLTFSYRWQRCFKGLCSNIAGAETTSYRATSADRGRKLRAIVTGTNSVGSAYAITASTLAVTTGPPVNVTRPTIGGMPIDGQTLTATAGEWAGTAPIALAYQWVRCSALTRECEPIPGATGSTYTAEPLDVAAEIEVTVTASNTVGSAQSTSGPTSLVGALLPANTSLPSIVGSLVDGQTLKALTGGWTGTGPISYSWRWLQCNSAGEGCTAINEATAQTLALTGLLVGDTLRVAVTATNAAGSQTATSEPTGLISALLPANTSLPSIVGSLVDGQTLKGLTGGWTGTGPIAYSWQWLQCNSAGEGCNAVNEATAQTLALTGLLVGDTLRIAVTATNAAGSQTATSEPTGLISALLPANTSLPSIVGSLVDGQTLKAAAGTWTGTGPISYSWQWQQCNATGGSCKAINEASAQTLALTGLLVGDTLRVAVTATNAAGSQTATSEPTGLIGALLPANTALPSIAGTLIDGQTLKAATGSWTGTGPIAYTWQWQQCNATGGSCKAINEASAQTLALTGLLVGDTLRVAVTATNAAGSQTATSEPTGLIGALLPANASLPSIVGSLVDGQTLKAAAGTWTGTGPISYSWQWQQCNSTGEACKAINEASAQTLALTGLLVGDTLRVAVTATNAAGSQTATSEPTGLIGALLPANTALPSIAGTLIDGQTLKAATGSWTGTGPIAYTWQWQQCNATGGSCKAINEASAQTLALTGLLVGDTLRVAVTATNAAGSQTATSEPTGLIGALLPANASLPSIVGSLVDGQTVKAATGSWTGTGPIAYSWQWQQCNATGGSCKAINEATAQTFALTSLLVGDTLRVAVTASNAAGSQTATSEPTGLIGALLPANTAPPSVAGTLVDGQTLKAATGSWTGTGPITYTWQWQQCNATGGSCKAISEATAQTFSLTSVLVGDTLRIAVTATNAAGSQTASSEPTGLVAALLPSNTALPSITGLLKSGQLLHGSTGTWTGSQPITYGYQWELCNALGGTCSNIAKAVEPTYLLSLLDIGLTLRLNVTATNAAGSQSATSTATGLIESIL